MKKIKHSKINKIIIEKNGMMVKKNRLGRNDKCLCGSGLKYKYCGVKKK